MATGKIESGKPFIVPVGTFSSSEAAQSFSIGYYFPDYILMGLVINNEQRYVSQYIAEMTLTTTSLYIRRTGAGYWSGTSFSAVLMKRT